MSKDIEFTATCTAAEELLIAESLGEISDLERIRLRQHLCECTSCRTQRQLLGQFHTALDPERENGLTPDPAVQQRLRAALPEQPAFPLNRLLHRRIPLYQAVLGAAAAILLIFATTSFDPGTQRAAIPLTAAHPVAFTRADSDEVRGKLRLLDAQSRGWDHTEDSLLIRFHPTILEQSDSI
ncbi:MAG: zf-HC2 domain-containing protein [Gemmatimonadetes bacterium]|jgi:hypothetical protein|nr:zf-HC2 domain-containing protein [Gemmatimonadota bacterium]